MLHVLEALVRVENENTFELWDADTEKAIRGLT
jgi:hypothetical protein